MLRRYSTQCATPTTFWHESDRPIELGEWDDLVALVAANVAAGSMFFSPATLKFFGSTKRQLIGGRVLLECQTASEHEAGTWVTTAFDVSAKPLTSCHHPTKVAARACAWTTIHHGFTATEPQKGDPQ